MTAETTALEPVTERRIAPSVGLDFAHHGQVMEWAHAVAGSGVLPPHIKRPGDVLAVYQLARELGLEVMATARGVHSIKGRLVLSADMMAAVVMGHGVVIEYPEYTTEAVTCLLTRPGRKPQSVRWTTADATRAGLLPGKSDSNWRKYPRQMLKARALSEVARLVCPDMLAGCYVEGELEMVDTTATVVEPPPPEPKGWNAKQQRRFFARLAEADVGEYEAVAEWCESMDKPRPSSMTERQRDGLLHWLAPASDAEPPGGGRAKLAAWVAERAAEDAADSPQDAPQDAETGGGDTQDGGEPAAVTRARGGSMVDDEWNPPVGS